MTACWKTWCSWHPAATWAAAVHCGEEAFIGLGVNIVPDARIGARATVGAGATIVRDIPADTVAVGNPARVVKERRAAA